MRLRVAAFLLVFVCCAGGAAQAQTDANADGPTALIVSYRALPGARAKFRAVMQSEGVRQLEQWRHEAVFASYQVLFTTFAGDSQPDMFLVLRFDHFSDLGRWEHIEETYPGGLPVIAQGLATANYSATADIVKQNSAAKDTRYSQFFVLEYDVLVDMPKYESYVTGYATPQFDEWEKDGVLSSYACFVNQNPAGAPWSSFIVLEYKDLKSLAARETVKNRARAELATTNAEWKRWSQDKTAIRTEKAAIPARALNLP
jgi:hypothetical protein